MAGATTLLVIGIHREELAFGAAVAAGLDRGRFDVLKIPDGLSGRHPRADQRFNFDTLRRALYLQLLPHIQTRHKWVIDLHTGLDPQGPCADIYSWDTARLVENLAQVDGIQPAPRLISLTPSDTTPSAETVIPPTVWEIRAFYMSASRFICPKPAPVARSTMTMRALLSALDGTFT